MLDSLSEACEAISDDDAAQRYKAEADDLAALFYGSSATSKPSQDTAAVSRQDSASSREAASTARDPGSLRRFVSAQSPSSPPPTAAVPDTAIRDDVASMMSRLGLGNPGPPDDVEDSSSIRQAERHLHETLSSAGDDDVIALSIASPSTTSNTELPAPHRQTSSDLPRSSNRTDCTVPSDVQNSSSSRSPMSSVAVTPPRDASDVEAGKGGRSSAQQGQVHASRFDDDAGDAAAQPSRRRTDQVDHPGWKNIAVAETTSFRRH